MKHTSAHPTVGPNAWLAEQLIVALPCVAPAGHLSSITIVVRDAPRLAVAGLDRVQTLGVHKAHRTAIKRRVGES
jgi:hypothetical protein